MKLPESFFIRSDVVQISKELLGKFLMTEFDGKLTGGKIVETEAYAGPKDKASHAYGNRRTKRTEVMFRHGGIAYIYLCYGIHHLFNIVTNVAGIPHAILIRGMEPTDGIDIMLQRRKKQKLDHKICSGPGSLSQALDINYQFSGTPLNSNLIWIEDRGIFISKKDIVKTTRIGVDYAGEDALLPWRFYLTNNVWVGNKIKTTK